MATPNIKAEVSRLRSKRYHARSRLFVPEKLDVRKDNNIVICGAR